MLGMLGVALVVFANLLRRLPWRRLPLVHRLVTPHPSEQSLSELESRLESKRAPLLERTQKPDASSVQAAAGSDHGTHSG